VTAQEILIVKRLIQKLIMEGDDKTIGGSSAAGKEGGLCTTSTSPRQLVQPGHCADRTAMRARAQPDQLAMNLRDLYGG